MTHLDICSDLHLDFDANNIPLSPGADILVVAGDMVEVELFRRHKKSVRAREALAFLHRLSATYKTVVWVFGNHEFYGGSFIHARQNMQSILARENIANIKILERSTLEVDGVLIYGATLWTSLRNNDPIVMAECETSMSDYQHIKVPIAKGQRPVSLSPHDTAANHRQTLKSLQSFVDLDTPLKKVLVTHHAISRLSIPDRLRMHTMSDAYASELFEMFADSDIHTAIHGHIHEAVDYAMGNVRVVSNPRGYYGHEEQASTYRFKTITVD